MWKTAILQTCAELKTLERKVVKVANHSIKEGQLRKKGGGLAGFGSKYKERYFILFSHELHWYVPGTQYEGKLPSGKFTLWKDTVCQVDIKAPASGPASFSVLPTPRSKRYELQAANLQQAQSWVAAINQQAKLRQHFGAAE